MTNGDTFYIKADGDIDAVAMWVTKSSNGHGFTVDDHGTDIRIRDIVSIEKCVLPEYMIQLVKDALKIQF